jgi:hypothetical protein
MKRGRLTCAWKREDGDQSWTNRSQFIAANGVTVRSVVQLGIARTAVCFQVGVVGLVPLRDRLVY